MGFPKLTFASQNCNSLNVSTECDKQLTKLIAITNLCTDIIFLSDLRLNKGTAQIDKIRKNFLCNNNKNYDFYYNSTSNRSGVGILIASVLNADITSKYCDDDENILGVSILISGNKLKLCAVYGPNHNEKAFFINLDNFLANDPETPVIMGGDWNATYSTSDNPCNPDILNMASPPSLVRSGWLADLCRHHDLIDPFRALHPTRRDFSFSALGRKNGRSRLDFFLISSNLITILRKCDIAQCLSSNAFDHKSIYLDFTSDKINSKPYINRTITDNLRTSDVVLAAFADTYLAHADPVQPAVDELHVFRAADVDLLTPQKVIVGRLTQLLREYNDLIERSFLEGQSQLLGLQIAEKETEINLQKELIWDPLTFQNLILTCNADYFLEALLSNIKGAVISFQTWVKRFENRKKTVLITKLNKLRRDLVSNVSEIGELEQELSKILDSELLAKVRSMKLFSCLNSEKPTPLFLNLARTNSSNKSFPLYYNRMAPLIPRTMQGMRGLLPFLRTFTANPQMIRLTLPVV